MLVRKNFFNRSKIELFLPNIQNHQKEDMPMNKNINSPTKQPMHKNTIKVPWPSMTANDCIHLGQEFLYSGMKLQWN